MRRLHTLQEGKKQMYVRLTQEQVEDTLEYIWIELGILKARRAEQI